MIDDLKKEFFKILNMGSKNTRYLIEMECMLDKHPALINVCNQGRTPLLQATVNSDIKAVTLFLKKGAEIEAKDELGQTALFKAVLAAVIHYVIEGVVDFNVDIVDSNAQDADNQLSFQPKDIIRFLLTTVYDSASNLEDDESEPLFGFEQIIFSLLQTNANKQNTNLKLQNIVELLFQNRMICHVKEADREVAFDPKDIIRLLLSKGADPNTKDKNNQTLLSSIVCPEFFNLEKKIEIMILLLKNNAKPSQDNDFSKKELTYSLPLLSYLLKAGCKFPSDCEQTGDLVSYCLLHLPVPYCFSTTYTRYFLEYGLDLQKACVGVNRSSLIEKTSAMSATQESALLVLINAYRNNQPLSQQDRQRLRTLSKANGFNETLQRYYRAELINREIFQPLFAIAYKDTLSSKFSEFTVERQMAMIVLSTISARPGVLKQLLGFLYFTQCAAYTTLNEDLVEMISVDYAVSQIDSFYGFKSCRIDLQETLKIIVCLFKEVHYLSRLRNRNEFLDFTSSAHNEQEERNFLCYLSQYKIPALEEAADKEVPNIKSYYLNSNTTIEPPRLFGLRL